MRGDLINNDIGRGIGKNAPLDWSDKRVAKEVDDALKRGDLVTDKQNDRKTLPENFPQDLNPKDWRDIPSDTWDRWLDQIKQEIRESWKDLKDSLTDFGKDTKT